MVDAISGAIYVIGGAGTLYTDTFFQDVWASTDGGARAGLRKGVAGGGGGGVNGLGSKGVIRGVIKG